ncbi:hypothetical protein ASG75_13125 [Rhodanobacter sp. Soil772]|uniref:autotransporter-associated beta strand repeat-containing protein n=1 Tax=Rhodanobacter sp. Soil772 TaxID=1736406 RepID=UPI0006F245CC|nr:autotransporter-associated beta strand repeat-containing protein [Rhodanobacter sp. Soil772]KRE84819.1 hypothetical protein ASG75_13125 [Rhodanobacter sp. Soil772]
MFDTKHGLRPCAVAFAVALALGLSGCGGGGGANVRPSTPPPPSTGTGDFAGGAINVGSGATTVWPNNIIGSIDLIKGGSGTLVLAGTDSYTDGTTINDGTLQLGNGGTTGSITGDVADNAFLVFDRSDNVTFNGAVSGTGSLTQAGAGALILTGANTYTGGTTISHGTLQLGNGGTTGSITGNVTDNGSLVFDRSDDVTFNGIVSGSGSLKQAGAGALILTGTNIYTGGTTISSGALQLQLGNGGTTGSITGDVADNGSLVFDRSNDITFNGIVSSSGSLKQAGTGTLILAGANTYTGGTTISSGTLQLGNGGTTGSITGNVTDNGSLVFNRSDDVTFNGIVSSSGSLKQAGTDTLILAGANTYTGGTTISNGTLQLGNSGTTGSITGDVTDNGSLVFNRSDDVTFNGTISGSGSLEQVGKGTLTLTGNNTYTGGTRISNGTLQLGSYGMIGSITGDVVDNGSLVFNRSDDVTFNGIVSGNGSLVQTGVGTLTLTGANTYAGGTTISSGTGTSALQLGNGGTTGSITGDVTDNGSLVFDRSDDVTFNGIVSGTGSLEQAGKGTLTLTGTNTYIGGTTISAGALRLGNGGTTGWIVSQYMMDNGSLMFDRSDDVIFNGIVYGSGSLQQAGKGTLILTDANQYTSGTTISTGTLQLGNGGTTGSIIGDVTDNSALVFDHSDDVAFSGMISGSGSLEQAGKSILMLTGTNTYTGSTTVSSGMLLIGNGGITGSITGNVTDNAALIFDRSDTLTFSGVVSGSGSLEQLGTGTLILTGDSTYSGGTAIDRDTTNESTLQLGDGGTSGSIAGDVSDNGVLAFDHSDNVTFDGLISGQGRLVKRGAGTLVLSRSNTYTGGSTVEQGTLEVLPGTSLGTGGINVGSATTQYTGQVLAVDNGADLSNPVALYDGTTLDNAGVIHQSALDYTVQSSGSGNVTVVNREGARIDGSYQGIHLAHGGSISNGTGSVISGYSRGISSDTDGAITVNNSGGSIIGWTAADLQIGDGISAVSATITNTDGGEIEGRAAGIVVLSDANILNNNGSMISGSAATYGTGVMLFDGGVVTNDGATIQAPGDSIVGYAGVTTVSNLNGGRLIGSVDLKADAANVVTLMAGSSIQGNLSVGTNPQATLTLNGDNTLPQSYSNAVSGTTTFAGTLIKEGTGSWNIDTSDLSGVIETDVNNGVLRSTNVLTGTVNVAGQGTLDGGPGVSGTLFNAGKVTVHDGDSAVGGNYAQSSTGTLAISLGSKLDVTGTATLNGGTLEATGADSGYVSNTHTNVLTAAGGLTGTFDQLVKGTGVVFTATTINYDANSAWLDTTGLNVTTAAAGQGVSYTPASFGSAQRVQGAFEQLDDKIAAGTLSDVSGDFLRAAGQFQQSPTLLAAQASLQSLSGQLHAASAAMTFKAIDASSRALSDRFDNLLDKGTGFGMWMHNLSIGGDMARAGFDGVGFQLNGWLIGSDRQIGHSGVAGYAFGQSRGQQRLDQSFDHDNSRSTEGMMYAGWLNGNWYTQGRAGFGHFEQDVSRQILLGDSVQGVRTQYDGNYNVAYGESGLHLGRGDSHVTPFVNVQYARIDRSGFVEQGAGGFGLRSNAQALDRWQAGFGVRAGHHWNLDGGRAVDFSARAQWQRTLASHGDVFDASFVGLQQWQPLVGIGLSRYSGLLGVGLDATLSAHTTLKFGYDYEMGQRDKAQMLSARLNVAF